MPSAPLSVRRAGIDEVDAVVALAAEALRWDPARPNADFFRWKHLANPFGDSPMWVAEEEGRLVGVRVFMRWAFRRPDGSRLNAVRAVDTATHPDARGRGVFTTLTTAAVDELRAEGTDAVFNTPNDQSLPGYLKMGWQTLGRVPIAMRPTGPKSLITALRARVPAEKWSEAAPGGRAATDVFDDDPAVADLLAALPTPRRLVTDRSPAQLAWRYGFSPLHYRVVSPGDDLRQGAVVFRVRDGGAAREATVCEVLVPGGDRRVTSDLLRRVRTIAGVDYLVWAGPTLPPAAGFVPLPRQGPVLTWRALADPCVPALDDLALGLGDVELF